MVLSVIEELQAVPGKRPVVKQQLPEAGEPLLITLELAADVISGLVKAVVYGKFLPGEGGARFHGQRITLLAESEDMFYPHLVGPGG